MPYIKPSHEVRHGTKPTTKSPRPKPPPTTGGRVRMKDTDPNAVRPKPPASATSSNCNHLYKELDTNVDRVYAGGNPYITLVDAVFYCEKCLDIRQVNKEIDNNGSKYTTL